MEIFKSGDKISLKDGKEITVKRFIGQGGQGCVYEAEMDAKSYALKWYLSEYLKKIDQKKFYQNLCENIESGPPSNEFLWPMAISEYERNSFGYIMELRPNRFSSFTSILNAKAKIKSLRTQLVAAKNICSAFQSLHSKGYSYQDINDGNFFVDVNTGDVLICDNDNVAPCGVWMGMGGKDRYMAPEVVLGKKRAGMESDLFSLAVVLYMLFFISHPLEGRLLHSCPCLTTRFIRRFYAEKPVFVLDPNDQSNRPVKGIDNNILTLWPCYPKKLQDLFIRSFTSGLNDAGFRVRESEWIDCIDALYDSITVCPVCGGEQFYTKSNDDKTTFKCEDCGNNIRKPFLFVREHTEKTLIPGVLLKTNNIGENGDGVAGEVIESTKHPGLWGIKNLSDIEWKASFSNGKTQEAGKNEVIPLFKDTVIKIGEENIKIEM